MQAIERILDGVGYAQFEKGVRAEKHNDIARLAPRYLAVDALPEFLSGGPAKPDGEYAAQFETWIPLWRQWISEHRAQLQMLQPTGDGVDFTVAACTKGRPRR